MQKTLFTVFALFTGFIAIAFSLILAVPLAIMAIITGKKLQKKMRQSSAFMYSGHNTASQANVIEGEYEEIPRS